MYGPVPVDLDDSELVPEEEAQARRQQAAQDLVNIGVEERQRRDRASSIVGALSVAYIGWASIVADDGGVNGHLLRFLSVIPVFFAVGYKLSAETGL